MQSKFPIISSLILSAGLLLTLVSCSHDDGGLIYDIQDKYQQSYYFKQVDESMIRAVSRLDTSNSFKKADQYIEKITYFEITPEDKRYDTIWAEGFIDRVNSSVYEELLTWDSDSNKIGFYQKTHANPQQIFDIVIQSPNNFKMIELKGKNPMGLSLQLVQGIQSGESPLKTLETFGL